MLTEQVFVGSSGVGAAESGPPPLDWDDWEALVDAGVVGAAETLPSGLERWEPGLFSHAVLASVDRERLSGRDLVRVLVAEERLIAHLQALQAQTMALLSRVDPADRSIDVEQMWEEAADEIGAALRLTRRGAEGRLAVAWCLVREFPEVWSTLARGEIDLYRARIICDGAAGLEPAEARRLVASVLERAGRLTSGQLRAWIRKLRMAADPAAAARRCEQAVDDRRVVAEMTDEGSADLCGYDLPPDRVAEARDRIERIARSLRRDGETRTLDQLRADVFLDLLCGTAVHDRPRGVVDITVELDTLAGLAERPGEIPGFGPVIADIARRLALEYGRTWQVTLTRRGEPVWTGVTRRRPQTALARRIRSRWPRCVFPGCRMPARACDLDHIHPWAEGGPTCEHNLIPLCRHHHGLRDRGWSYVRRPDGTVVWTSPLGWEYTTEHPP